MRRSSRAIRVRYGRHQTNPVMARKCGIGLLRATLGYPVPSALACLTAAPRIVKLTHGVR